MGRAARYGAGCAVRVIEFIFHNLCFCRTPEVFVACIFPCPVDNDSLSLTVFILNDIGFTHHRITGCIVGCRTLIGNIAFRHLIVYQLDRSILIADFFIVFCYFSGSRHLANRIVIIYRVNIGKCPRQRSTFLAFHFDIIRLCNFVAFFRYLYFYILACSGKLHRFS